MWSASLELLPYQEFSRLSQATLREIWQVVLTSFLSVVALRHHYHHEFFWHVQNSTVTRGRRTHIYLVFFICQECTILFHSQDKLEKENHMIFSILRRKRSVKAIILVSQFGKHKETKSCSNYRAHLLLFCQIVRLVMEI